MLEGVCVIAFKRKGKIKESDFHSLLCIKHEYLFAV
jgi:hypothetical protein